MVKEVDLEISLTGGLNNFKERYDYLLFYFRWVLTWILLMVEAVD